ncbi:hypothetical protein LTR94_034663, partial [Friedmanniomyces endolithicus]
MIQVLEHRGYVRQGSDGYVITERLFHLGLKRPPVRSLMELALPEMRSLADRIGQSLAHDVEGGTVDRFEHRWVTPLGIDIAGRGDAQAAGEGRRQVAQDVGVQVGGDDGVERGRAVDHARGRGVDQLL